MTRQESKGEEAEKISRTETRSNKDRKDWVFYKTVITTEY